MNRISFLGVIVADGCNPNGDPVVNNMPRQDYEGHGLISPDCIRRKLRNRLAEMGAEIFCQNQYTAGYDGYRSLAARAEAAFPKNLGSAELRAAACEKWIDVRAFGQVFSFSAKKAKEEGTGNASVGVRGPVSISGARSLDVVIPQCLDIVTTALSSEKQKGTLTFGHRYVVNRAAYVFTGGICPQPASLTGFSEADAELIHDALRHMYDNDASYQRPEGSIVLHRLLWWEHSSPNGSVNPVQLFRSVELHPLDVWPFYSLTLTREFRGVTLDDFSL